MKTQAFLDQNDLLYLMIMHLTTPVDLLVILKSKQRAIAEISDKAIISYCTLLSEMANEASAKKVFAKAPLKLIALRDGLDSPQTTH